EGRAAELDHRAAPDQPFGGKETASRAPIPFARRARALKVRPPRAPRGQDVFLDWGASEPGAPVLFLVKRVARRQLRTTPITSPTASATAPVTNSSR